MHLQTGKGENIDAVTPGMISVTDNPNPVDRRQPDLSVGGGTTTTRGTGTSTIALRCRTSPARTTSRLASTTPTSTTRTRPTPTRARPYSYNFVGGVPNQITYRITPRTIEVNVDYDFGDICQDRWTIGRWTLPGGIRYDAFANSYPPQALVANASRSPAQRRSSTEIENLKWKDITPKMGATYDLFGNGRTALKFTLNKYLEGMGTTGAGRRPQRVRTPRTRSAA